MKRLQNTLGLVKANYLKNEFCGALLPDELLIYFFKNFHDHNMTVSERGRSLTVYNSKDKFQHGTVRISDYWLLKHTLVFDQDGKPYQHDKKNVAVGVYDAEYLSYKIVAVYPKLTKPRFSKFLIELARIGYDCTMINKRFENDPAMLQHVLNDRMNKFNYITENYDLHLQELLGYE